MKEITCPFCGNGPLVEDADRCPKCRYNFEAVRQRAAEEQRQRDEEELAERREREATSPSSGSIIGTFVIIAVVIFAIAGISKSQAPTPGTTLFSLDRQTINLTADNATTFQANGKTKIAYECRANTGGTLQVQLVPVSYSQEPPVWQQQSQCPATQSNMITLPAGTYYVTVAIHGNAEWNIQVSQG